MSVVPLCVAPVLASCFGTVNPWVAVWSLEGKGGLDIRYAWLRGQTSQACMESRLFDISSNFNSLEEKYKNLIQAYIIQRWGEGADAAKGSSYLPECYITH